MNLSAGYPFDLIRNGIPFDYPKLSNHQKTDVVIMGGGISGALVAYYLLKAGVNCVLIDRRSIGLGSTCASTSLLQYEIDKPLHQLASQIGNKNAQRAYFLCGKAIGDLEKINTKISHDDFHLRKSIYFAAHTKDLSMLKKEFDARKQSDIDVNWMEADELENNYGLVSPGAIVSSLAAQTNAYTLTHALHQFNVKKGMKVYDRTAVVRIDHQKRGVKLITAEGHRLFCKQLVYATGYEAVKYIDKKIVTLSATYATISEQFADDRFFWNDKALVWNTADPYLYARISSDNRIMVGGRDEPAASAAKRDALIVPKSRQLCRDFKRFFPGVPFKNEFSWTGIFGSTKDGLPFIGHYKKLPNSLFALGFGGNGITFSVIAAQLLKNIITGTRAKDLSLFSFERI